MKVYHVGEISEEKLREMAVDENSDIFGALDTFNMTLDDALKNDAWEGNGDGSYNVLCFGRTRDAVKKELEQACENMGITLDIDMDALEAGDKQEMLCVYNALNGLDEEGDFDEEE